MKPSEERGLPLSALCLTITLACGGNSSSSSDSDGGASSGGTDGNSSGGTATASSGGATSAVGGTTGGAGGAGMGGSSASAAGGDTSSGGSETNAGGTSSGGTNASGGTNSGGSAGETSATGATGGIDAGGSAGTGGSGGSGGTGPTGAVGTLGEPCDSPGQLACAGNYQKLTVVCGGDGEWEVNQTCSGDQFCDTREGATAGTCQDPALGCAELMPGDQFCDGSSLMACGADTVASELVEECTGVCEESVCNNAKDACPEADFTDCAGDCDSTDCGGSDDCPRHTTFGIVSPLTIRVPSYDEACAAACDSSMRGAVMSLGSLQRVKVTVGAPWLMAVAVSDEFGDEAPCDPNPAEGCLIVEPADDRVLNVFTNDPSAGPRNAYFEVVDEEATCPE